MSKEEIRRATLEAIATAVRVVPDKLVELARSSKATTADDSSVLFQSALLLRSQAELLLSMSGHAPPPPATSTFTAQPLHAKRAPLPTPGEVHFVATLKPGEEQRIDGVFHHRVVNSADVFESRICQRPFRGSHFTHLPPRLLVLSLRVGVEEQLTMSVPSEALEQMSISLADCFPGQMLTFAVKNETDEDVELDVVLHGSFL